MPKVRMSIVAAWLGICVGGHAAAEEGAWEEVQKILMSTKDIVVLDGIEKVPPRYEGEEAPTHGDWMVRHLLADPEKLNPYTSSDAAASRVLELIFERLLDADHDPPYNLRGWVAVDYPEVAADKLAYTFELRDGVYFSDGKPLTAADVVFSMKVIHNPQVLAPHLRNYYATVQDVQIVGTNKVRFLCREPYFRNDLILGGFYILPKHFYDPEGLMDPVEFKSLVDGSWEVGSHKERVERFAQQFNQNFNRKALGSGSYLIEDPERDLVTQQKVVLTRNVNYWGRDMEELLPPGFVDKMVFKIINNTDAAFIELTNGHLDYHGLRPLEFKEKSWSDDFNSRFLKGVSYSSGYLYIGWNNNHPIFGDKRVRQAMTYLTDREGMVENIMFGLAETVEGPINKFRPEYNHDLTPYTYDPDRALDLLAEAGWADADEDGILDKTIDGELVPFSFEILINSGNQLRKDIALTVQYELQDIGIDCQVRELDWSIFLQKVKGKSFDAMVLGWTGSLRFSPDAYQIWHSSQTVENGSNHVSFINDEVDNILETYRREFDMDKRIELYRRFQEILHEEQPYTFMWKSRSSQAYSRRFSGVTWYPPGARLQDWWVAQEEQMY
ncbi:MAG: peptide-binding protein [Gemmatimonadetes bacterium]|nr:peptide-binding protein [Gemmatimonadota bacterium]MDE2734774.1 peptide-binding protein [Gemmatimonadota bacterium]